VLAAGKLLCDTNAFLPPNFCYLATLRDINNILILLTINSDGHYGLWLDDIFEKGISSRCLTFGNEPLSDVGEKFDILGVELWHIG
jgi:TLD